MFSSSRTTSGGQAWRVVMALLLVVVIVVVAWAATISGLWSYAWFRLGGEDIAALDEDVEPLGTGGAAAPAAATTVLVTLTGSVDPTIPRPPELLASPALLQVGGSREQPAVLILPDDLEVAVDGHGDLTLAEVQRVGGTDLLARAVVDYTQVRLDHVVSMSIDALPRLIEQFEDLEVCLPSGCSIASPESLQLSLARSDDERVVHEVLGTLQAIGAHVDAGWVVRSPLRAKRLVDIVADEVHTDAPLRGTTLLTLAETFAAVRDIDLDAVPVLTDPSSGALLVLEEPAAVRFQHLREGTAFAGGGVEEAEANLRADVEVALLNAAGIDGLAGTMQVQLAAAGYVVIGTGNAPAFDRETSSITYRSGDQELAYVAALLAEELGGASLEPLDQDPTFEGEAVDILVLLGPDLAD